MLPLVDRMKSGGSPVSARVALDLYSTLTDHVDEEVKRTRIKDNYLLDVYE
jgi:hypothetical protein